ncbi:MAG: tRNA lysidine(34) synthetase TilS, partial [Paracoccus sp. (in: a-proteobacteria)]|nr:tRNA lysidine(34) synthetase TilS [Paracoccus sp. (in: a-proteobacteria)]
MPTDPDAAGTEARAMAALDRLAGDMPGIGIALSGGGDSVALLHLAARWAAARGRRIAAATVDHGLRPGSDAEAERAGRQAAALMVPHQVLRWHRAGGGGNLMAEARAARLDLLAGWARDADLPVVVLGHTRDDLAETLLMRLARGAGIDGLAAMAERRAAGGVIWLRPLLDQDRATLRGWLRQIGASWDEDPTNADPRYERARIRQAMATLGLDSAALALSARHLAQARDALNAALMPLVGGVQARAGSLLIGRREFESTPPEQRRRLILAALRWITGDDYPPRRAGVATALTALAGGRRATLGGAVLHPWRAHLLIHREAAAAARAPGQEIWDRRWHIKGLQPGDRVSVLGE